MNKNIGMIKITGTNEKVEFGCVLYKDYKTTQKLFITGTTSMFGLY
jgi:hypothetical protein